MTLTPEQRQWQADKFGDLANYTLGSLLIGQLISKSFRLDLTFAGLVITGAAFIYGNYLLHRLHH